VCHIYIYIYICSILVRFGLYQFGLSGDIEKAFLNICLHPDDRNYTRFFWLSNPRDPSSHFNIYRFKVVPLEQLAPPSYLMRLFNITSNNVIQLYPMTCKSVFTLIKSLLGMIPRMQLQPITKKHEPLCPVECSIFVVGPPTVTSLLPMLYRTRVLMITALLTY